MSADSGWALRVEAQDAFGVGVRRLLLVGRGEGRLLEVVPNPRSGRSKLVVLTPRGFARRRQALELLAELEDELADRIGRRRVTALRDGLEQK